jgi:hypothetical protein
VARNSEEHMKSWNREKSAKVIVDEEQHVINFQELGGEEQ